MFKKLGQYLILLGLVATVSCTGEFTPVDPSEVNTGGENGAGGNLAIAKEFYDTNIQPIMQGKCSACHAGAEASSTPFLTVVAGSSYNSMMGFPSITGGFGSGPATLLTKGAHQGSAWWDGAEEALIKKWFDAEKAALASDDSSSGLDRTPVAGATDPTSLFAQWSGCMTLENWEESNMGSWRNKPTNNNGPCQNCHSDGPYRFNTNPDSSLMFAATRYQLFMIGFFSQKIDPAEGVAEVIINKKRLEYVGNGTTGHPRYNTDDNDDYMERLQEFYDLTMQTKANGECGPAEFPQ